MVPASLARTTSGASVSSIPAILRDGSPVLGVRTRRVVGHALPGLPHPVQFVVAVGRCFVRLAPLPLGARLGDQPRLAQARFTDERDDPSAAGQRFLDRAADLVELALAADQR